MARDGGKLKSTSINGVKLYSVASEQPSLATWVDPNKRRALRKNQEYQRRVELIQDLRFETATTKIKATPDGEYVIASGIYPPQVKVYELRELSLKFERHLDSEIIDFQVLSDDYSKLAFLCANRSVYLHAKYGKHYSLRIPRMGRDMAYDCWSCDLLCAASSPELYRINLEQGRFLSSLNTQSPALNVVSRSKLHGLVACGGEDGAVECFDLRMKSPVGRINAVGPAGDIDQEVTAVEFDEKTGFSMAVGSSAGKVLVYDLRSSHPIHIKDHMYGSPILDIKWHQTLHSERPKLITTDNHVVRIWDPDTGEGMTSIEPTAGAINDLCTFPSSGLMLLALDCSQIPSFFIPELGPAPNWCSYLQNLTEELEEDTQTTIYDNYKFLTKEEIERFRLTNMIGTNLLRAYMHGFFVHHDLYKKVKAMVEPADRNEHIEQQKKERLEKEFSVQRITKRIKLPKVNEKLAVMILEDEKADNDTKNIDENETNKPSKKRKALDINIFDDDRFKRIFEDKNFEIDEYSQEYKALHPVSSNKRVSLEKEHFRNAMEDQNENHSDSDTTSEDEPEHGNSRTKGKRRAPRLIEAKDERHAEAFRSGVSLRHEELLPLGERVKALRDDRRVSALPRGVKLGPGGTREISFRARGSGKYGEDDNEEAERGKRRGVQSLGLKQNRNGFGSRGRGGRRGGRGGRGRGRRGRG
ncbi:uncharacterized protein LOC126781984 [Argentina anserina]|uniref:uncharacterized protein LOC126781984 n=1 Tax=Argentina anserina TaxID=57926 RepID=UPI0021767545|nr:uncharacterized protein LOC126781984 [Potentilla anserina]